MAQIKSSKIGLRNIHVAEYNPATDRWTKPVPVPTIKEMSLSINRTDGTEYADDQLFEVFDSLDNWTVDLTFADLTPSEQAFFLGFSEIGAIKLQGSDNTPPWVAIMGERRKADGTYRLFKFYKGKARPQGFTAQTKGGQVSPQPDTLQIVFGPLDGNFPLSAYANQAYAIVDQQDPDYDDESLTWYEDVIPGQTVSTGP